MFVVGGHYAIEHVCETYQVESRKCFEHATHEGDMTLIVFAFKTNPRHEVIPAIFLLWVPNHVSDLGLNPVSVHAPAG